MECPNCKFEVSEGTKVCPNCNYDFENKSYKNIEFKKLNIGNKILSVILVIVLLIAANSRHIIKLSSIIQRENRVDEVVPTYFTINHYDDFKQQYPEKAKEIETYVDHFLKSVNMDRSNRVFNESYHILDGEIQWELWANIGEFHQWKCYAEMKEQDGQVVMTASYIDFTMPDRVNADLLKKMARVMGYNALLITKLYEDYLEDYQTSGKVRKEIQIDSHNKVVFAYVRSPNGNSLMIDMTRNF